MNNNAHLEFINQMLSDVDLKSLEKEVPSTAAISSSVSNHQENEILELGNNFSFDGFQVVRREFFAHKCEPSIVFNSCKFSVNTACIQRFPDVENVQVLVNKDTKILAIMPCMENARDSFSWCAVSKGKRKPKQITCKLFFAKVFSMMGWNPDYRYKILGKQIHANGEYLIAFDLTATEVYQRTFPEGAKPKTSRIPVFPVEWQNQFGLPYNEHKQSLQVNILDGYAVYSIKDDSQSIRGKDSTDIPVDAQFRTGDAPENNT